MKKWIVDGEFKTLNLDEIKELTPEEKNEYQTAKDENTDKVIKSSVEKLAEKLVSKDELKEVMDEIKALKDAKISEKMDQWDKVISRIQKATEEKKEDMSTDKYSQFKEVFKHIKKGIEFEVKAVATRSTVDSSTMATRLDGVGRLASPGFSFTDYFRVIPVNDPNGNGSVRYIDWDSTAIVRAAAATAEGGTYNESTADFKEYQVPIEKITDSIPVTEEFLEDVGFAQSELEWFLSDNMMRKENEYLYDGTGSTPQMTGIYTRLTAFASATYTGSTTPTPDIVDLKDVLLKQILGGRKGKYDMTNIKMFVNDEEYLEGTIEKDTTGHRIWTREDLMAQGIVATSYVDANKAFICDVRFPRIYKRKNYNIEIGRDGSDFTKGLYTMRADLRETFVLRQADVDCGLKVTDIGAAIISITT